MHNSALPIDVFRGMVVYSMGLMHVIVVYCFVHVRLIDLNSALCPVCICRYVFRCFVVSHSIRNKTSKVHHHHHHKHQVLDP